MTTRKTYYPIGLPSTETTSITDSALAYVKILEVDREGVVYSLTDLGSLPTDTGLFFGYNASLGRIQFLIPFQTGESINVIYETNP